MPKASSPFLIILAFFSIYVLWGSTYLLNKIAVAELAPFMLAATRFLSAGLIIFLISLLSGKSLRISRKQVFNTLKAGFLFLTLGNGVVVWALKYVDSGFAALVISAQPLMVLLFMRIFEGKKIKPMSMVGVVLGIIGIYLLVSQNQITGGENSLLGIGLIFLALCSWAYGSLFVAKADLPSNYFVNTGYQMFFAGILLAFISLSFGEEWSFPTSWAPWTLYSLLLLIFLGSIVAFTSFNYLLKIISPEKVATSTYVNPVIALLLGWYFLDEQLTLQSVIAAAVLLTGVYFINTKKKLVILSRFTNRIRAKEEGNSDF